ncbi:TPA: DNA helicase RecG [candidate division CPR2 bacterium]|nr:MAG: ATP-dependent DNA helicase RecG [candidate division CPR2 bacterium GWD2_39_7]HBG81296.1 DNA helicase RecG [candidate division CPR2 bacterium]HCL99828.1 DNA helicase RecG [candidate division CPR2 bacterium]
MNLNTSVETLSGVGANYAKKLHKLGLNTVEDLLLYYPRRYEDFSTIVPISKTRPGESITIKGNIWQIANKKSRNRRMTITEAVVADDTGTMKVTWFNQPFLTKSLKMGDEIVLAGKPEFNYGQIVMISPAWEKLSVDLKHVGRIVPVYPETEGLTSKWLRYQIKPLLKLVFNIKDPLPETLKKREGLTDLPSAVRAIHFPNNKLELAEARKRLAFDELFIILLSGLKQKMGMAKEKAVSVPFEENKAKEFVDSLSFSLTNAQKRVCWEIIKDLKKDHPMNRLVQGDVGSGKTIVAAFAMYLVAKAKYQAVLMAPTEILAKQHFDGLSKVLVPFGLNIGLITGKEAQIKRQNSKGKIQNCNLKIKRGELIKLIKEGDIDVAIGTHALVSDKLEFKSLALAIVDEQHRFGVDQRQALRKRSGLGEGSTLQERVEPSDGNFPHFLSMTATPIPRSLQLTIFGDLDVSVIDELPPGRQEITTKLVSHDKREAAYEFIKKHVSDGRQCFVICPLVKESEKMDLKAATDEHKNLSENIFPNLKVGLLHGKMKSKEKEEIMNDFKMGKCDILVSTSVIEVGVDVPNASIMVIEGAERFGLAQLHQFRGRVGRGEHKSYCLLFTNTNTNFDTTTTKRLNTLVTNQDGFKLAESDLEIRGPGEFMGTRQSGWSDLKIAKFTDIKLISKVRDAAQWFLGKDPELKTVPVLKEKVESIEYARE